MANNRILVRGAVQAVSQLKGLCENPDTPTHMLVHLECVLETLSRGLMGQPMWDEKVTIGVVDGAPVVLQKTDYVAVEIATQGVKTTSENN